MTLQAQKQATSVQSITQQQSLVLVRNLLRTAISSIAYIRHLFPESCFQDRVLSGMNVKTLLPTSQESKLIIEWLEKGVFEALEKKYLRSLIFGMYFDPSNESTLIECYNFRLSYDNGGCTLDLTKSDKDSETTKRLITKDGIRQATVAMIRTLISLAQTLTPIPDSRFIVMKLFYYDDITPPEYEPPFFRPATEDERLCFHHKPLRLNLGTVKTPYHSLALQIRTAIDCVDQLKEAWDEGITKPNYPITDLYDPEKAKFNSTSKNSSSSSSSSSLKQPLVSSVNVSNTNSPSAQNVNEKNNILQPEQNNNVSTEVGSSSTKVVVSTKDSEVKQKKVTNKENENNDSFENNEKSRVTSSLLSQRSLSKSLKMKNKEGNKNNVEDNSDNDGNNNNDNDNSNDNDNDDKGGSDDDNDLHLTKSKNSSLSSKTCSSQRDSKESNNKPDDLDVDKDESSQSNDNQISDENEELKSQKDEKEDSEEEIRSGSFIHNKKTKKRLLIHNKEDDQKEDKDSPEIRSVTPKTKQSHLLISIDLSTLNILLSTSKRLSVDNLLIPDNSTIYDVNNEKNERSKATELFNILLNFGILGGRKSKNGSKVIQKNLSVEELSRIKENLSFLSEKKNSNKNSPESKSDSSSSNEKSSPSSEEESVETQLPTEEEEVSNIEKEEKSSGKNSGVDETESSKAQETNNLQIPSQKITSSQENKEKILQNNEDRNSAIEKESPNARNETYTESLLSPSLHSQPYALSPTSMVETQITSNPKQSSPSQQQEIPASSESYSLLSSQYPLSSLGTSSQLSSASLKCSIVKDPLYQGLDYNSPSFPMHEPNKRTNNSSIPVINTSANFSLSLNSGSLIIDTRKFKLNENFTLEQDNGITDISKISNNKFEKNFVRKRFRVNDSAEE